MIKTKLTLLLISFIGFSFAQQTPTNLPIHIEGLIVGGENQKITITNQVLGGIRSPYHTIQLDDKGKFSSDFGIPFHDYFVGTLTNGQSINLILRGNDSIKIYGDAKDLLYNCNILGSNDSKLMMDFYKEFLSFKRLEDSLKLVLKKDPSAQNKVNTIFGPKAQYFMKYRETFLALNPKSPATLAALSSIDPKKEKALYEAVVKNIIKYFPGSGISSLLDKQLKQQQAEASRNNLLAKGKPAPEISVPNADGKIIKLSDLKGKVVLVDFWASWCGPCRKENPNVVANYKKYNKSGFEVFSVSFDKPGQKARWLSAIQQDGLIWPNHGSELKGFGNQAARDYGVRGIPFTCLVDAEGNIVATNLRGVALGNELKKIYGY